MPGKHAYNDDDREIPDPPGGAVAGGDFLIIPNDHRTAETNVRPLHAHGADGTDD